MRRSRPEDLAYWGGFVLEDLGIVNIDFVVGTSAEFGSKLKEVMMTGGGELKPQWCEIATGLILHSPAMMEVQSLFAGICQLAASAWYVGRYAHAAT